MKDWQDEIQANNNGSQPAETGQRCSQIIFETWMKRKCLEQPLIDCRFGYEFQSLVESDGEVPATFTDQANDTRVIRSRFLVSCDGGQSRVRKSAGVKMVGGQMLESTPPSQRLHTESIDLGLRQCSSSISDPESLRNCVVLVVLACLSS